jgi:hypothetical protein
MEIRDVKKLRLTILYPLRARQRLAFWTVPVRTRVIRIAEVAALVTLLGMTAESGSAARLDCCHDASLRSGQQGAEFLTISLAVAAEDIRHFQLRTFHEYGDQKYCGGSGLSCGTTGRGSRSKGLDVEQTLLVAIRRYRAVVARLR